MLAELTLRGRRVALVVTDQRMPGMTGIEMMARSARLARTASCSCSPPTPTPTSRSGRSTTSASTTTCSSRGSRPRAPLPRRRRPARGLAAATTPDDESVVRVVGHPWVRPHLRRQDVPRPQPRPVPLARRRARRGGASPRRARRADDRDLPLVSLLRRGPRCASPTSVELADALGLRTRPSSRSTTCASSAAGRPASPPPSTPRPRGCAPSSSSATPRAARPARAPPSRTTSASRRGSRGRPHPPGGGAGVPLRRRDGARPGRRRARAARAGARGDPRRRRRGRDAGGDRRHRRVLPAARGARVEEPRLGAASTTAPRRARRRSARARSSTSSVPRTRPARPYSTSPRSPSRWSCSCGAPARGTRCRSTSSRRIRAAENVEVRFRTEVVAAHGAGHLER